jgi:oligosaccharide repeat unit polymerase
MWVLIFRENYQGKSTNKKIVKVVSVMVLGIVAAFFVLGLLKQYQSGLFKSLGIYGGSGLYNFNLWLEQFDGNLAYGKSTFNTLLSSIKVIFDKIGIQLAELPNYDTEWYSFISLNGYNYSSNIFSALKPYVQDFGYFGVLLFPFVIGFFYQCFYCKAKNSKHSLAWILYCMLSYPIIFFPVVEQMLKRFHLGLLYEVVWLVFFYRMTFGGKNKKAERSIVCKQREVRN